MSLSWEFNLSTCLLMSVSDCVWKWLHQPRPQHLKEVVGALDPLATNLSVLLVPFL